MKKRWKKSKYNRMEKIELSFFQEQRKNPGTIIKVMVSITE